MTTCLECAVGGKQGHAPCKILRLPQFLFLCQSIFMNIIRLSQILKQLWPHTVLRMLLDLKQSRVKAVCLSKSQFCHIFLK